MIPDTITTAIIDDSGCLLSEVDPITNETIKTRRTANKLIPYIVELAIAITETVLTFADVGCVARYAYLGKSQCRFTFTGYSVRVVFPQYNASVRNVCLAAGAVTGCAAIDNGWKAGGYEFEFIIDYEQVITSPDFILEAGYAQQDLGGAYVKPKPAAPPNFQPQQQTQYNKNTTSFDLRGQL